MKKIFLTILMIFALSLTALCEELYPLGSGKSITKETHPIYYGYLEDYASLLREAFEKKKMFKMRGWGSEYYFVVTRDGTIKDVRVGIWQNDYFDKKIKEIIMSVKPLPFREGMDLDSMYFDVYMGYEAYEQQYVKVWLYRGLSASSFSISIILQK